MFKVFYIFVWTITWLPLRVLYVLSDIMFLLIYYVVGYRKKVVRKNLSRSFPEKDNAELRKIERKFYRFFCDLFIETLSGMHMSNKEILNRVKFNDIELFDEHYQNGKSVLLLIAHYGNWEWISAMALLLPKENYSFNVYKKINDSKFNNFMLSIRARYNGINIETHEVYKQMLMGKRNGKISSFGMIADQSPWIKTINHRIEFLHQDTPVFSGTEQLAKKFNYPVFYVHMQRIKRGHYNCEVTPISINPKETTELEITKKYFKILEEKINEHPEYWLWTHNRWKYSLPMDNINEC